MPPDGLNPQPNPLPTPPSTPPLPQPPKPSRPPVGRSWARMMQHANTVSGVITLLVSVALIGGAIGWWIESQQKSAPPKSQTIQTLTPQQLQQLSDLGTNLGTSNQTLNIGANALFRGTVNVISDLTVGGRFNANGAVTLSQLNITGTTALSGLSVGSNLTVSGATTLQQGLTVSGLTAINGGLNVSGTASVNALNASSISVTNLSISGPLLISHIVSQGAAPNATAGSAVGAGGTMSLSGNDTAGTINVNTGSNPPAGILATVVFRGAYTGTPHIQLTPLTGAAAGLPAYVTRTATGFQVRTDTTPPAGAVFAFDYLVAQ